MRRLLLILLASAPLTGCQFLSAGEDVAIIDPFEGAGETISEAGEDIAKALDGKAEAEPFAGDAKEVTAVTADLIQSTDPEARTRLVQQSRIDPFAMLPIPLEPDPVVTPVAAARNGRGATSSNNRSSRSRNPNNGGTNGGAAAAAAAARPSTTAPAAPTPTPAPAPTPPPVRVQEQSAPLVRPSPIVTLPRIPQPIIAPTVSVSGVIQLGGEPYAIVSAGNEPERYVRVGDRLAGGSVRVKRIDTMAFEPQVIFEENGIEVSRPINSSSGGETEAPEEAPAVPVVALPSATSTAAVPSVATPQTTLPMISSPAAGSQIPALGAVPGSLLLLPPGELTSQRTLPNMRISVPEMV